MTYLSQFPKAKLKPGAPLRPKLNPKKARAYGPGTHKHTHLQLDFNSERNVVVPSWTAGWAESRGDLRPWTQKLWAGPRGWTQTLVSSTPAALSVSVQDHLFHNAQYIFCSFLLCEGIEPIGNVVMKKAVFTVETISAGMGEVLVYVEDPAGHREEVRHRPCGRFPVKCCLLHVFGHHGILFC